MLGDRANLVVALRRAVSNLDLALPEAFREAELDGLRSFTASMRKLMFSSDVIPEGAGQQFADAISIASPSLEMT